MIRSFSTSVTLKKKNRCHFKYDLWRRVGIIFNKIIY